MSVFSDLSELAPLRIWDGVTGRVVGGDQLTLAVIELAPDAVVPEHSHVNEQVGVVIDGRLTFRIHEEERELGPGGGWSIPPHVPHQVRVGAEGAIVAEAFAPARSDWDALERLPSAPARWRAL